MIFRLAYEPFQLLSQWHIWRLGLDLADIPEALKLDPDQVELLTLHQFFRDLLDDLYANPHEYGLPNLPYEAYTEPRQRLAVDKEQAERIRAARLKMRVAIEAGIFDFLYQIGQAGEPIDRNLHVERTTYDRLLAEKIKKTKNKAFLQGFARLGFDFMPGEELVIVNQKYPGLPAGLSRFAKACAAIRENGFYFFRRCDLGVLFQKTQPVFEDALRFATPILHDQLRKTDALLAEHKFKREILVGDGNAGYRFRYNKKNDKIVYWVRLMSWFSPDFHHSLRWPFESDLTRRLFAKLDELKPGLADRIFDGIKKCEHDYVNCKARVIIERGGLAQECCSEVAWDTIGETPADFDDLRLVLSLLDELVSDKKKP